MTSLIESAKDLILASLSRRRSCNPVARFDLTACSRSIEFATRISALRATSNSAINFNASFLDAVETLASE